MPEDRRSEDRRKRPEQRQNWERISRWRSAPKISPYRYPFVRGIHDSIRYPYG